MSLGEFQLISRFFQAIGSKGSDQGSCLEIGIGDDAAVIKALVSERVAISTDTLVESVHFPKNANPELLARRALRVNLSDMAAMGAQPRWFSLALTLADSDEGWLQGFSSGLRQDAENFGCQLIGGDTTKGPLNIGIHMMGTIPEDRKPLTRSGAKPGDLIVVTGTLGDAGAALQFDLNACDIESSRLEAKSKLKAEQHFLSRYWLPTPRIDFAIEATDHIHAACDISDGLIADIGHLCSHSQLSATVDLESIPLSEQLQQFDADANTNAKFKALSSGDDYELCMAVSEAQFAELQTIAQKQQVSISVVGKFNAPENNAPQVEVRDNQGKPLEINHAGYTHF